MLTRRLAPARRTCDARRVERSRRLGLAYRAAFALAAVGWAVLRLSLGEEYEHAPWADLVRLDAPRPFGHRVLVPLLLRGPIAAGVPMRLALGIVEAVSAFALLLAIDAALRVRRPIAKSGPLTLGILGVLAVVNVAPRTWPVFYPWDTPALAVLAGAVVAAARGREGLALVLAIVGALNRESAILVPIVYVVLRLPERDDPRGLAAWACGAIGGVLLVRLAISLALPDNPGPSVHFTVHERYRLLENLRWMADPSHWPRLALWGGFVVLLWPWLGRRAGWPWRRLALPAVLWWSASMVAANVYEPRAFGESILLALLVLAIGPAADEAPRSRALRRVDRFGSLLVLGLLLALAAVLTRWPVLPVAQWPMPK
jgi:hypothetical protein